MDVWISNSSHPVDIRPYVHGYYTLARLLIKLNTYMLFISIIFSLSFLLFIVSFIHAIE